MSNDFLWVEKYRPKTIAETILPKSLKETFQKIVDSGELPNMLLSGTAGLGKTTVAKALCNELDLDYIVIRGFIEEFSNNCRFILTCNFKNRIIEPLHSRCGVYEFNTTKKDMVSLCEMFMDRACTILDAESVEYDKKVLPPIIMKFAPDWRRILNELQRGSHTGFVVNESTTSYDDLFEHLKSKDFKKMRAWVVNNIDTDAAAIFRAMYDRMSDKVDPQSIPQLVLILADYQYKNAFVADHELNVVACLTEVMANVKFS